MIRRERFAPSPTGHLHLGHAYSALLIWETIAAKGGEFILRIEDIDKVRSKTEFEKAIFEDLDWLGITWAMPILRQSERMSAYREALEKLDSLGVCYPCRCSRRDIRAALSAPQENGQRHGFGLSRGTETYPGTCRAREMSERTSSDAIRLNIRKAIALLGGEDSVGKIGFRETSCAHAGEHRLDLDILLNSFGDVILARKDVGTSYHLSVVVDDAEQKISHVTRGEDLLEATHLHRLLQVLLDLSPPVWCHHPLVRDEFGKRLAKRDAARSIRNYRKNGFCPADIRRLAELAAPV